MANLQSTRVITRDLRIRSLPHLGLDTRTGEFLQYGQKIVVDLDTETIADAYVWWQLDTGFWSAARSLDNTEIYIEYPQGTPAQPPPPPPVNQAGVREFRVLTGGVRVRDTAGLSSNVLSMLQRDQVVRVDTATRTEMDGFVWWEHNAGGWSASNSIDQIQRFMEPYTPPVPGDARLIEVQWVWASQLGPNAPGAFDCGPACVYMLIASYKKAPAGLTVGKLAEQMPGKTSGQQLIDLAAKRPYRLILTHVRDPFHPVDIQEFSDLLQEQIDAGKAVILKVWYSSMRLNNPAAGDGSFEHWVVVIGYDQDNFLINDPLWNSWDRDAQGGSNIQISVDRLWMAHKDTPFKSAIS